MGRIAEVLIKAPLDAIGRRAMQQFNTPMGVVAASTTGAVTGLFVADSIAKDGPLSKDAILGTGLNVASGAFLLGVGSAYHKPYFTTAGKVTLGATLVGAIAGGLGYGGRVIPDIQVGVEFNTPQPR